MKLAERFRMALAAALLAGTTCAAPAFADEGEETPGMVTLTFVSDGDVKESREVSVDGMVGTPPSTSKAGYSLDGWFDSANHKVSANTLVAELASHAVTAKWSVITYTITYRNGSATLSLQPSAFNINSGVLTLPMSLSKDGWDFVGWYDNPNPTGTPVTKFSSTSIGDKTFYAKWSVIDYSITYKDGTKTIPDLEPHCYNIESGTVILPSDVQKSGYIFDGWFTNPDFEGDPVTTVTVTDCEDKTYYAKFEEDIHWVTLTFVSMGEEVESREVSDDGLVGELPSVSEPGYDLIGWFDDFGQQIFDYTPVAELSSYTIYAEWSIITYKIMYRDGTNVIPGLQPSSYKVIDKTVVLPTDAPKSGYLFNGWYDNIGLKGDPIAQFDATDCEDKTYYAKYELDAYPLWIAGRQVTGANATNVLGDAAASVSFAGTATNGTLTLRDAAIEELLGDGHAECGIYAGPGFALTIAIEGTNLVGGARFDTGVRTDGPLEIVGGGALAGIGESTGIDARNGLAIDEATVFAEGKVEGIVYGELAITNGGVIAAPPWVANVAARQRWPWNGLVDVDYEVGGFTAGLSVRISFAEQSGAGRAWVATNFLAGAEPRLDPGRNRATWDAKADGATNVIAEAVTATVELVREE